MAVAVWVKVKPVFTVRLAKFAIATAGPVVTLVLMIMSSPATGNPAGDQVMDAHVPEVIDVFVTPYASLPANRKILKISKSGVDNLDRVDRNGIRFFIGVQWCPKK